MGKGAYVQITNLSSSNLTISYSNFNCMFTGGDEGSNFDPISGTVSPGNSLPASGAQYIEAKASGGCAFESSTFTMSIQGPDGTLSINFSESSNTWSANTSYTVQAELSAAVSVREDGDQYRITVGVYDHNWSNTTWMADTASTIGNRMLKDVVLPGTHDSGTYAINALSTIAPGQDLPQWVNAVYALGLTGVLVAKVIADWAKTQPVNIGAQLAAGIRYFDLRVVLSGGEYYICHGMFSAKVDDVIGQLSAFVNRNPKEIVILDFNHLYEMSDDASNKALADKLVAAFGDKMAPNTLSPTSTFNDLWSQGYQVIALYANDQTVGQYSQLWPQSAISSPWPNTTDMGTLQSDLDSYISNRGSSQLFVLQGILTPDGGMIAKGLVPFTSDPSSIEGLAAQVTPQVMDWVQGWSNRDLNIIIVDWFMVIPDYVDRIVRINLRIGAAATPMPNLPLR